ncbi:BapA prefix-like domain-containing protein, partial [Halomonas sp. 707D4]
MSYQAKVASLENDVTAVSAFDFDTNIVLSRPSQVLLQVAPEDIASMLRDGNDLVIELTNGETLRVIGFYADVPGQSPSELYLTGEEDQLIPVELNTLSNGTVIFAASYPEAEYAGFEQGREKGAIYMDDLVPALALGGLGAAAIGLARGSSSSSDSPASPPVDEGEDGVADPAEPDDPIEDGEGDPEVPGEPDDPVVPGDPDDPEEPGDPDDPDVPGDPDDPEEPGDPDDPEEPGDPTLPPAPTLTLVNDTGSSDSDGVTRDGTVQVGGLVDGNRWEFSLDGGATWTVGQGDRFVLPEGEYGQGQVQVRQIDPAGNTSPVGVLAPVVVDTTAPAAPTLTLENDTGEVDGITSDGSVIVGDLEPGARWEYSIDGGASWIVGEG